MSSLRREKQGVELCIRVARVKMAKTVIPSELKVGNVQQR